MILRPNNLHVVCISSKIYEIIVIIHAVSGVYLFSAASKEPKLRTVAYRVGRFFAYSYVLICVQLRLLRCTELRTYSRQLYATLV